MNPEQTLDNAMKPIIDEMFQNGPEEGCRIWEDASHPLHQAIAILLQARCQLPSTIKAAAALLEQHRRMEEFDGPSAV
jgi:gamma-glutamyl phosphate reductase